MYVPDETAALPLPHRYEVVLKAASSPGWRFLYSRTISQEQSLDIDIKLLWVACSTVLTVVRCSRTRYLFRRRVGIRESTTT